MGASDWAITTAAGGGADTLSHSAYQHSNITTALNKPSGDIWARRINNPSGAAAGRAAFLYNRGGVTINETDDISIRAAFCIAPATNSVAGESVIGMGCRLSSSLITGGSGVSDGFMQNGYHLVVIGDDAAGTAITLKLVRMESSTPTTLWSDTRSGVNGTFQWFHLRLDMLVQPNGDLDFLIFENDLGVNQVDSPVWGTAITTYQELADDAYTGSSGVGWGAQAVYDSGDEYAVFADWIEIHKSQP